MAKNPGFITPDTDLRLNKPELLIEVDRDRAADQGVAVDQVARTIETMLGGRRVTEACHERQVELSGLSERLEGVVAIGAEPALVERWMEEGLLPNLSGLRDRGSYLRIESTMPAAKMSER